MRDFILFILSAACISGAVLFLPGCGKSDIIAKVGQKTISIGDLKNNLSQQPLNIRILARTEEGRKKLVENLVNARVLELEAMRFGITDDPEIKRKIEEQTSSVLISGLLRKLSEAGELEPKDEEIKKYYEDHIADFKNPVSVKISQILVTDEAKLEAVKKGLLSGKSFESLVAEYSEDSGSKGKNGDMGYIKKGDLIEELDQAAFSLKKTGEISQPVASPYGSHIIKLTDRRASDPVPYQKAYGAIKNQIVKNLFDRLLSDAKKNYKIKIYDDRIVQGLEAAPGKQ